MKKLLAAAGLYLVVYGAVAILWWAWTNTAAERGRHAIAMGELHAAQLKSPAELPPLHEACEGKLEKGTSTRIIAAYIAKGPARPADDNAWDEVVVGVRKVWDEDLVREGPARFGTVELLDAFTRNANPVDWKNHLSWARTGSPELEPMRYLVVAKYFTLSQPVNQGTDGYTRGAGEFSARVLGFPQGDVLCEGAGQVRMKEQVNASGRGATKEEAQAEALNNAARLVPFVFSLSVTTSPLHALCDVGGEGLCKLTSQWVGKPPATQN